jgi:hypothetical protein
LIAEVKERLANLSVSMRSEVLTAVKMSMLVLRVLTPWTCRKIPEFRRYIPP